MSETSSCAYVGSVVHKRLWPKVHAFRYRVFCLALDVDEIDALASRLRLFSRNRWNVLSFHDLDHGSRDGTPAAEHARSLLARAGLEQAGARILLLCYPRLLGFVFNPLSVYFCYREPGALGAIVYEVSNTHGERRSYVIPVTGDDGTVIAQSCGKEMYVSPFTSAGGTYDFHVLKPDAQVVVGVAFRSGEAAILKTHFRGRRRALSDSSILSLLVRHPLMTLKVVAAIHFEALRLWLKRVPVVAHHPSPAFAFTVVKPTTRDVMHVQ